MEEAMPSVGLASRERQSIVSAMKHEAYKMSGERRRRMPQSSNFTADRTFYKDPRAPGPRR